MESKHTKQQDMSKNHPHTKTGATKLHVVLFPFLSKGHTIPLLHLSRLLLRRGISVTFFTTAANRPFIASSLSGTAAAVISLPFPENIPGIPAGADALPCPSSLFPTFVTATELMKPHFHRELQSLSSPATSIISDGFLWWTQDVADTLGIPRFVFNVMSCYAMAVTLDVAASGVFAGVSDETATATVPSFPWIEVTAGDFLQVFRNPELDPVHSDFVLKCIDSEARCSGVVYNSFVEIEPAFYDHIRRDIAVWSVGPFCLANEIGGTTSMHGDYYLRWLDERLKTGRPVLYVAFGSQAEISEETVGEIARGLEDSGVDFLWAIGRSANELGLGGERGLVVREWVDQRRVLNHRSVRGFLSHCGWNSVMESVSAGVPILAWPIEAEQPLNARLVVEEIGMGMRLARAERGAVAASVRELMGGGRGSVVRENAEKLVATARAAVAEGGSSWLSLESLVEEMCAKSV